MAAEARARWYALSVRAKTTIAATLVVSLALVAAAVVLAAVLQRSLVSDLDQVAELRATALGEMAERGSLDAVIQADDDEAVQVLDARGRVIATSRNVAGRPSFATVLASGDEPAMATIEGVPGLPGQARLLTMRTQGPSGPITIAVATDLKHADSTLALAQRGLYIIVPLLIGLVALTTWLMVGRALRPVEEIRSEVVEISRGDLARRVPVGHTNDEVSRLARTMNEMLEQQQAALDKQHRFVSDASHELRSPLAAVRADLEVALAHPEVADWPTIARELQAENQRMEALVADLLFMARSDGGVTSQQRRPVDLHDVVLDEVARTRTSSRLQPDTSGVQGAFVVGRRADLARIVRNLLDNAQRYARSSIAVTLGSRDGVVTLTVDDDGPGVPSEHRESVFDRFSRVEESRSRAGGGTGLGLAIVREIAEQHDGRVTVSRGRLRGALFTVTLPAD